ncbi:hypothetical protein [Pseudodesulfovibrio pelocollis]|uniref:hypothetical protein n=1 Tax=Pseudodesulfovibrio pelocollis TaxID=3051432 RepID=UPI00255A79CF|nr:hypothetical protein [Pseudodesulfovibrio sp. SB368]
MGWKNVKEHYRIKHIVQVRPEKGICIGSPYVSELIVVDLDGRITKRYEKRPVNADLHRYQQEMNGDPDKLRMLIQTPDSFSKSIPVYTFDGAQILEKYCEELGWPNITHDGELMYDNTFFENRADAIQKAVSENMSWSKALDLSIAEAEKRLEELRAERERQETDQATLEAMLNE